MIDHKKLRDLLVVVAAATLLLAGGWSFTASNTVPASKAGDGSGVITGFVLSSVRYNLNATNPANITSVTYSLDSTPPAGSTIRTQLFAAGAWYTCTNIGSNVTCATTAPQATVATATDLRVVIAQ